MTYNTLMLFAGLGAVIVAGVGGFTLGMLYERHKWKRRLGGL